MRSRPGRVVVLVTRGTSDEPPLVTSTRKESVMRRNLMRIKEEWTVRPEERAAEVS